MVAEGTDRSQALFRVFEGIARAWALSDAEKFALLAVPIDRLQSYRSTPTQELPPDTSERIRILVDIFKAINTLLPSAERADAWIRKSNAAPLYGGRSALAFMVAGDLEALRAVRAHLEAEIWGR